MLPKMSVCCWPIAMRESISLSVLQILSLCTRSKPGWVSLRNVRSDFTRRDWLGSDRKLDRIFIDFVIIERAESTCR